MDNNSIKENIERIRIEHHLSQTEMAKELGISRNTYRKLEKGNTKLISDNVFKIANLLKVAPEEVLIGQDFHIYEQSRISEIRLKGMESEIEQLKERIKTKDESINILEKLVELLKEEVEKLSNKLAKVG